MRGDTADESSGLMKVHCRVVQLYKILCLMLKIVYTVCNCTIALYEFISLRNV